MSLPLCKKACSCVKGYVSAYPNPEVEHISLEPIHRTCVVKNGTITMDLNPSFTAVLVTAIRTVRIRYLAEIKYERMVFQAEYQNRRRD